MLQTNKSIGHVEWGHLDYSEGGGKNLTENNIIKRDKLNISVHNSSRFSLEISDDKSFFWSLMPYPSALKI
jgi:hypothetical protein